MSTKSRLLKKRILSIIYHSSAAVLICCLVAIAGFPSVTWIYWATAGSALAFSLAAVARSRDGQAGEDAAWLARLERRNSKNYSSLSDDFDD